MPLSMPSGYAGPRQTVRRLDGKPYQPLTAADASLKGIFLPTTTGMGGRFMYRQGVPAGLPMLGGEGQGGGGQGGFKMGPRTQGTIDAHPYGDTFATVNTGHSGPLAPSYTGPNGFGGLDEFYANNPLTPTAEEQHFMNTLPTRSHGGPVPAGQPFIAGDDPKGRGKENREMIIPMADGSTHVVPMKGRHHKGMPKLGRGTVKMADDHGLTDDFGRLEGPLGPDERALGVLKAFDTEGQLLGFGTGVPPSQRPASVPAPEWTPDRLAAAARQQRGNLPLSDEEFAAVMDKLPALSRSSVEPARAELSKLWQEGQAAKAEALERARNPEGIIVGVTPRAPLNSFQVEQPSREEAQFSRLERQVMRGARGNNRLAMDLLGGKAQAEADAMAAQAAQQRNIFNQNETTKRTAMTVQGANERAAARLEADAAEAQAKLQREGMEGTMKIMGQQQRFASMVQSGRIPMPDAVAISQITQPEALKARLDYYDFNRPTPKGPMEPVEVMPGSGIYAPGRGGEPEGGFGTFEKIPGTPAVPPRGAPLLPQFQTPGQPAQPTQFKPMKEASAARREEMKTTSHHLDEMEKIRDRLALADAVDSTKPLDQPTKDRLKRWLKFHEDAYEKAYGLDPTSQEPPPAGAGGAAVAVPPGTVMPKQVPVGSAASGSVVPPSSQVKKVTGGFLNMVK